MMLARDFAFYSSDMVVVIFQQPDDDQINVSLELSNCALPAFKLIFSENRFDLIDEPILCFAFHVESRHSYSIVSQKLDFFVES